jgi:predicted membrane metal-binding protein
MIAINRNPSAKDLKWFGLLVLLFFGILGAVARWRFGAEDAPVRLWIAGAALCLVYYAIPPGCTPRTRSGGRSRTCSC